MSFHYSLTCMDEEIILYDAKKYRRKEGFVKVECLLQHPLDDADLKEEIVKLLLDSPYPQRAVKLMQETCNCTKESACRVCLEIAADLYEGAHEISNPVAEEEDKKHARPTAADPGMGLLQIMQERKDKKHRPKRHIGVANKTYTFDRVHYFYTDPSKLKDTEKVRILT